MSELTADAVVVGTGAGGAAVAAELAVGGIDVVVLEEGARHDHRTFTARPRDMTARLYRDAGQLATIGTPPIVLPLGRAVGGTTLINSGTCFRTPARVLERWAREDGLAPIGDEVFAHVEEVIGVAEVP
jgi:choline dehydrogenase-like flavoprotein